MRSSAPAVSLPTTFHRARSWPATLRDYCATSKRPRFSMSDLMPLSDVLAPAAISQPSTCPADRAFARGADVVRVGVIGFGYWGPNVVRNFHGLDQFQVAAVCDRSESALRRAARSYPGVQMTTAVGDVLMSPDIDA